jgi:hypothetical protein
MSSTIIIIDLLATNCHAHMTLHSTSPSHLELNILWFVEPMFDTFPLASLLNTKLAEKLREDLCHFAACNLHCLDQQAFFSNGELRPKNFV